MGTTNESHKESKNKSQSQKGQNSNMTGEQRREMQEKFGQSPEQVRRDNQNTYQSIGQSVEATKRDESPLEKPDEKPSPIGNWGEKFRDDETLATAKPQTAKPQATQPQITKQPGASETGGLGRNSSAEVDGNKL